MSSLFDSLISDKPLDSVSGIDNFSSKLSSYKDKVVYDFVHYNVPLNDSISKIAKENNFTDDHIKRLVEESNNQTYLVKYAQLKDQKIRSVDFDVADFDVIKSKIGTQEEMKKSASVSDGLNAFNYTPYETGSMAEDVLPKMSKIASEKISDALNKSKKDFEDSKTSLSAKMLKFAETMISLDTHGAKAQEVFDSVCRELGVRKAIQDVMLAAVPEKLAFIHNLPKDYSLNLKNCDVKKEIPDFSIGKHTFLKEASVRDFPVIQLEDGSVIKNVSDVSNLAKEALTSFMETFEKESVYKSVCKKIGV